MCRIFWLLIFIPCFGNAQKKKIIKGEVLDIKTEEKISGVSITTESHSFVSADGTFSLASDADSIKIMISAVGYENKTITHNSHQSFLSIRMQPVAENLSDVVVSGTLRQVSKLSSPIPVESYSAKFFKKNPTPSVFEALSIINGVQPQLNCNVCNTGDIHINGMDGPYTMVLIDGMPIVSSLSTVYGLSGIPTSMIKRIEIVKGPASTLYGSEAVGGLINIITKDPLSADRFAVEINHSSLAETNVDISSKFSLKNASTLVGLNAYNYSTKHDINHDNFTDVTQQKRLSLFNKWSFERKKDLSASLAIRLYAESRWGGELNWTKKFRGSDSIYGESIYTKRGELIGNYGIQKNILLEYSYNFHQQDSYYGIVKYFAKQHTAFAQLRWNKTIGKHYLLAGIPFRYIWYDDNTPATHSTNGNKPGIQTNPGIYIQDEYKLRSNTSLLMGMRYEYNNIQGGVLAPRLALKWQATKQHTIRFSAGNGYRIVNLFTEDHAALTGARDVIIRNNLKPERSWNGNLNYTGQLSPRWGFIGLDASLFYTYFTNKIIPDFITDPQKIIYDNLDGHAVSAGVSANMDIVFKNGLKILGGFTWMDVYTKQKNTRGIITKEQQQFAPRFSANYAISYTVRRWNITFDVTGKIFGPMRLPIVPNDFRPEYSPTFSLTNLQATKKISNTTEVYLSIKNIFNFIPKDPILRPFDPFDKHVSDPINNPYGYTFDPSYNYAPIQRIKALIGVRFKMN